MIVTSKIKMDFQNQGIIPRIEAVQGDVNTRVLELSLYTDGAAWEVPADVIVQVRYRKANGVGGIYDLLPDGAPAWEVQGNCVRVYLAPQMLTVSGLLLMQVELLKGGDSLSTFPVHVLVSPNLSDEELEEEAYVNMLTWAALELDERLEKVLQSGAFVPKLRIGTVSTLEPGSQATADISGPGHAPALHLGIPGGFVPRKGTDYWTEAELEDVRNQVARMLQPQIAEKLQQSVVFVNSREECTDTGKIYVLPDGYLYAYMKTAGGTYTDIMDTVGYHDGKYVSGASLGNDSATVATDVIAYPFGDALPPAIYFSGVEWTTANTHCRLVGYTDAAGTAAGAVSLTSATISQYFDVEQLAEKYYKISPKLNAAGTWIAHDTSAYVKSCVSMRMSFVGTGEKLVLTLGEPIETTVGIYRWCNTGLAFVPADYEDRILALEAQTGDAEERLSAAEAAVAALKAGGDSVPGYVRQEAERVADLVAGKRTARSLVFAAASDFHYPYDDQSDGDAATAQAVIHTGMGIGEIRKHQSLDFIGLFGDYVKGAGNSTVEESKAALKFIHNAMHPAGLGVPQIWMQGNHDRNPYDSDDGDLTEDELYAHIFAHNAGCVVDGDNVQRGYGYRDFEAQRIRVIYWNSSDVSGVAEPTDHCFTAAQYRWMAGKAFDLSGRESPESWGIVMLSHMPVNWDPQLTAFVDAYISGAKVTLTAADGETVTVDFRGKNPAEFICAVNGHTHNFRSSRVGQNQFWQIAVPQVCAGRYNEYGTTWPEVGGELDEGGNPVYYKKTANSANDTSFCVFVVDRKHRKIHAIHYGAGIDREMSY